MSVVKARKANKACTKRPKGPSKSPGEHRTSMSSFASVVSDGRRVEAGT